MGNITIENLSVSPLGNPWIEVGTQCTAYVMPSRQTIPINPYPTDNNRTVVSVPANGVITGSGFGMVAIAVGGGEPFNLYVGSVIIAGADGNSWQVFPDGSCRPLPPAVISQRINNLEAAGLDGRQILFADVGNNNLYDSTPLPSASTPTSDPMTPGSTAVTCYLLNLLSVKR